MEQIALKANVREGIGKEKSQKLRRQGMVPAVVYHRGEKSVSIQVVEREIAKILRSAENENVLINLSIEGAKKKTRSVIIKEIQQHPVKRSIIHVDFNEISLNEAITVEVEVVGQGEPVGVKQEGGVLEHTLRHIKIQCLPTEIPGHIDVDISGLKLNGSVHVKDLVISDKIKVLTDPEALLFQVKLHVEEKAEEPGAVAPELEVIREKKEDETAKGGEKAKDEPKKEAPKSEKK